MSAAVQPLYAIALDRAALLDQIIENGGEITPEVAAELDALADVFEERLAAWAVMAKNLKAESEKHGAEARRQSERAAVLERAFEGMKARMKQHMEDAGIPKVAGVARIQANSQPSVKFDGRPETLPVLFQRVVIEINRQAVLDAKASGVALPAGVTCETGAHLRLL